MTERVESKTPGMPGATVVSPPSSYAPIVRRYSLKVGNGDEVEFPSLADLLARVEEVARDLRPCEMEDISIYCIDPDEKPNRKGEGPK